jgi:uncharacterized protein YjbI with pentapeptide repeats
VGLSSERGQIAHRFIKICAHGIPKFTLTGANLLVKEKPVVGLRYADFNGANLNGIYVVGEDLRFADFIKANLSGADLSGAKVTSEQLKEAKSLQGTIMPDGQIHPE